MVLASLADEFVGSSGSLRQTPRYALVYRSVSHKWLTDLCDELSKQTPKAKFQPYFPTGGFERDFKAFASLVSELKERRHEADYDPTKRFKSADANLVIETGRSAIARYGKVSVEQRKAFLTMLLLMQTK